jgi:hypothetical protein
MNTRTHQLNVTRQAPQAPASLKVAPLTLTDIALNSGIVRPREVPLFVGVSTITVDGKRQRMSVSNDRNMFWIRFPSGQLPASLHQQMKDRGFAYSSKKRLAYFAESTPAIVKHIRGFGYDACQHIPAPEGAAPVANHSRGSNMVIEADTRPNGSAGEKVNTKTKTVSPSAPAPARPKFVKNKAGLWMYTDTGKLAAKADVAEWLYSQTGVKPDSEVLTRLRNEEGLTTNEVDEDELPSFEDMDVVDEEDAIENSVAYTQGYEDGVYNAEDPEFPGVYSRFEMAKAVSLTVDALQRTVDEGYIQGYLAGFEAARPSQVAKGLKARLGNAR